MSKPPKPPGLFQGYGDPKLFGLRVGAVLLTALSQPFLSAPFNYWPLHWIAWIPFLWAITQQEGRGRLWLAALGGTVSNYMIFYWIVNLMPSFSNIPTYVAILLNLLLCMWLSTVWVLLAWLIPKLRRDWPQLWTLAAPAWLAVIEFATPQLFPYMQGVSHYQVPTIFLLSSITGIYGVSFLIFWCNCILFHIWQSHKANIPWPRWQAVLFLAVLLCVLYYGVTRQLEYQRVLPKAKHIKIGLIQSNFRPNDHGRIRFPSPYQTYIKLSQEAAQKGAQWIVWSEGEFKYPFSWTIGKQKIKEAVDKVKRPILAGGYDQVKRNGKLYYTNSARHFDLKTGLSKPHQKVLLVPFGEYMPLERELNFVYKHISWRSRYAAGPHMIVNRLDNIPYGFLICYEAIYPSLVRDSVRRGARLLVNITYDAWFGRTTAPYQHLMLAATRSAETGVPLVRLATTGVSTAVDALGRVSKFSKLFKREVLVYDVPLVYLPTFYTRYGDVFAIACIVVVLLFLLFGTFKGRLFPGTRK